MSGAVQDLDKVKVPKVMPMAANKTRALRVPLRLQAALTTAPHWHVSINKIVRLIKPLSPSVTQKCYIECDPLKRGGT